jgi:hypothetical protein
MRRRAILVVTLVATAALLTVLASTGSADHPGSQTLTFVERDGQGTFRFVDIRPKSTRRGEPSVSPGDSFYGTNPLYNAANTRRVGRLFFKCAAVRGARTFGRATFLCEATVRLSDGTLSISATFKGNALPAGPVIGGTGAYEGANGGFSSVDRRRTTVDTLHFDLE